jgi:hypothetical protein
MTGLVLPLLMTWYRPTTRISVRLKSRMSWFLTEWQGAEIVTVLAAISIEPPFRGKDGDHTESRKNGTDYCPCYECGRPRAMFVR